MTSYLDVVLGDRAGFLAVAYGYDPHYDASGKYTHKEWIERRYPWPTGREQLERDVAKMLAAQERVDVYACPAIRFTDDRRKGSALPPQVCWGDFDSPVDAGLLATLDPFVVQSGSDGHRHIYLPLSRPVDLGLHARLNKALADRLGGDHKWSDESLLRLPGTLNYKTTPPAPVVALPWSGRIWDPEELATLLGVEQAKQSSSRQKSALVAEPPPQPLPGPVQAELDNEDTEDRSKAHHRVVGACRDAGLSLGQALAVVSNYGPSLEKYGTRLADEVVRSWAAVGGGEAAKKSKSAGPSQATRIVQIALTEYDLGCTPDGDTYAIPKTGPRVVRLLRGGRGSLRAELARAYFDRTDAAASQSALTDACMVLDGKAQQVEPIELHLRVAAHQTALVLDLGDPSGRAVVITAAGWRVVDEPPVRFRRTAATGALPDPARGGALDVLWHAVNVAEKYRPLVLAVLVAALVPNLPHPVVAITGEQGTGKSTATRRLASIIDPSPAQLRKAPKDVETWTTAAAGSWVVALDNLSGMSDWLSDAVCRACTGDGDLRRRLFSDGDLHVISFRRVTMLNGIDLGALRGDLADRLVHVALDVISPDKRRLDRDLDIDWRRAHPRVLGAVLDLTVKVLAALPGIELDELPRMADYARVLAAVDQVIDTQGLDTYKGLQTDLAEDAATSDPVLIALTAKVVEDWSGTSADLLTVITPHDELGRTPKDWPKARALTTLLRRQAPALRQLGWVVQEIPRNASGYKVLRWRLRPPPGEGGNLRREENNADNADNAEYGHKPAGHRLVGVSATDSATARRQLGDAENSATLDSSPSDAEHNAETDAPQLTSANGDHSATSASSASNPYLHGASDLLAAAVGRDIPGGCDQCDAYQTVDPDPFGEDQMWHCTVHHDEGCPELRRLKGRAS